MSTLLNEGGPWVIRGPKVDGCEGLRIMVHFGLWRD